MICSKTSFSYRCLTHVYWIAIASVAVAAPQSSSHVPDVKRLAAGRLSIFEFSLHPEKMIVGNPFSDVRVAAIFTASDGHQKTIKGFYAGSNVWKLRFAPDKTGLWKYTYEMRLPNGALVGSGSHDFSSDVVPAPRPVRALAGATGGSVLSGLSYPIGIQDCIPLQGSDLGLIAIDGHARTDPENLVSVADYLALYGAAGFNLFRFSQKNCTYDLYDDLDHYRETEMAITDKLLTLAHINNFHVMFGFFGNHNGYHSDWENGGAPEPPEVNVKEKAFIDYCIARFGVFVDVWELVNERNAPDSWTSDMASFVHGDDPYGRPVSTSWERPWVAGIDINSPHWYESESELDSDLRVQQQAALWQQFGKTVIVGEQGNAGMNWDPLSATRMRIRLWASLFQKIALVFWNTSWSMLGVNGGVYVPGSTANIYLGPEERGYTSVLRQYSSKLPSDMSPVSIQLSSPDVRGYAMESTSMAAAYLHHSASHATVVHGLTISLNPAFPSTGGSVAQWIDPASGQVLSTAAVNPSGTLAVPDFNVDIALRITSGVSVPVSGSVVFLKTDTTTQGSWKSAYGADGYNVIADNSSYPSYVTVTPASTSTYVFATSTSDVRALQKAQSSTDRVEACWYWSGSNTIDLNFLDQNTHQVALYLADYDNWNGRTERVDVVDGNGILLDSRNLVNFTGGEYLVWNLSGHVAIQITNTNANSNALVTGLFFGGASAPIASGSAAFVQTDTTTQGSWKSAYGADGYNVIADNSSYPSYVTVTPALTSTYVFATSTNDVRALQKASSTDRVEACWYWSGSNTIDLNFLDKNAHQVALYLADYDNWNGRAERVDVVDGNGILLDSRNLVNFTGGEYLVWNLSGHVTIQITNTNANSNALVSGLFFGGAPAPPPSGSAAFVKTDASTQGLWMGVYGADGFNVVDDLANTPGYVTMTPSGNSSWIWSASSTDARALEKPSLPTDSVAACWYSPTSFSLDLNFTDQLIHQVALYLLDWDRLGRIEQVDILDVNGNVLDTRTVANFGEGQYWVWKVSGHVIVRITNAQSNGVLSGIFFSTPN